MRLPPKIQGAIQAIETAQAAIETARAEFGAVLREFAQQTGKAPAQPKRSRATRDAKPVAKKKPASRGG